MNWEQQIAQWYAEERAAVIKGWDFSHIHGRYEEEEDLPWRYEDAVRWHLFPEAELLDIDTGGGEFLLSLGHPCGKTSATEGYPPNAALCRDRLLPLGIHFREASDTANLPFSSGSFDLIINRHGDYSPQELFRLLKPGGIFITEQVGEWNDRELVELLLPGTPRPFVGWNLTNAVQALQKSGFTVQRQEEAFRPIRFYDAGALVWFAKIIEWEFPGFSVEKCLPALLQAQEQIETSGVLEGRIHRFLIVAEKPHIPPARGESTNA